MLLLDLLQQAVVDPVVISCMVLSLRLELWQTDQVCGWTKGPPRHSETWWWNDLQDVLEEITSATALSTFQRHLKTFLFRKSFPDIIAD